MILFIGIMGCRNIQQEFLTDTSDYSKNIKKRHYTQRIKSLETRKPQFFFKVIVKTREIMRDYIALHGLAPQNELPLHLRYKIPKNEIWMREDIYNNIKRRERILTHEYVELYLMITYSMCYKKAHMQAEYFEGMWFQ